MKKIYVVGADVHKKNTQLVYLNRYGKKIESIRMNTQSLEKYFANFPKVLIGMEVSIGSQYLAKKLEKLGHSVKVIPPSRIKAFYTGPKNDERDALAIAQATMMHFVEGIQIKPDEALIIQGMIKQRSLIIKQRVALCNQLRGVLVEQGIKFSQGKDALISGASELLKNKKVFFYLKQLIHLSLKNIKYHLKLESELNEKIIKISKGSPATKKLQTIPGFGPLNAVAFLVTIGNPSVYKSARDVSAFLGLVPRQYSSGEKIRLGRISKKGPKYTRTLLIHGARSFMFNGNRRDKNKQWLLSIAKRRGYNKAIVAWANKMARIAWAVLVKDNPYQRKIVEPLAA